MMQYHLPSAAGRLRAVWLIAGVSALVGHFASTDASAYELSRARRIIVENGIQLAAWHGFYNNMNVRRFWDASYTTPDLLGAVSTLQLPGMEGTHFGAMNYGFNLDVFSPTYADQLIAIDYEDDPGPYRHPGELPLLDPIRLAEVKSTYEANRAAFPNALCYLSTENLTQYTSNASGMGGTEAGLRTYIEQAQPDMLMQDVYPPYSSFATSSDRTNYWYPMMAIFRRQALLGVDGTGTKPLVYGQFMKMYRGTYSDETPSESYVRMERFTSLSFGFQYLTDWIYSGDAGLANLNVCSVMFDSIGDTQPNAVYDYVSKSNAEIRNLTPALTRLVSTGVFMKSGSDLSLPSEVATWSARAGTTDSHTDYITGITPYTNSTANGGRVDTSYADIVIGYFEPLLSDNGNSTFVDGLEFMIVNGAASGTAAESAQWYHLTFDFTGSDFDSLVRLSRDTGLVEAVPLTHISRSRYYLDLNLSGGTGDLFAFWDSSTPLPTLAPEPGMLLLLATAVIGIAAYAARKQAR